MPDEPKPPREQRNMKSPWQDSLIAVWNRSSANSPLDVLDLCRCNGFALHATRQPGTMTPGNRKPLTATTSESAARTTSASGPTTGTGDAKAKKVIH